MIQRIQSLWLFLAALVMLSLFYFSIYKFRGGEIEPITIGNDYLGIVLLMSSVVLSLLALFQYKNRKRQIPLVWINVFVAVALQVWLLFEINQKKPENITGYFGVGAFVPLVVIVFLFLAKAGISKDERLIKSLDRLR